MKLIILEKSKKDIFISIFGILKTCSSVVTMICKQDKIYIQGMDKAHICLFDITLQGSWFNEYQPPMPEDNETVIIDSYIFYNILSIIEDSQSLSLWYDFEAPYDQFHIDFRSLKEDNVKKDYDKFFNIPLLEVDSNLLDIPEVDYDVDFSIKAKKICDITSQLLIFGDIMNINCGQDDIFICCKGVGGEMTVNIPIDDLSEYSIAEGETMNVNYSLTYLSKMCMTTKLSSEIEFGISTEYPMRIKYDLGEGSKFLFFIAPKIE
jgi:proliferating cell nuclear antigen PCNA